MQNKDEAELIARSLDGDHQAYGELVDRYKNALYRHCFVIVRDEDVAEDIAQETFVTAFYKLRSYKSDYRLSTWLFKIATNKALNHLKREARQPRANNDLLELVASEQRAPKEQALDQELHEAVERLQPNYRAVVSLYYWHGLEYRTIAQILGAPEGSVKGWMNRAKAQLRKELA